MAEHEHRDHSLVRVGGHLHKLTPIADQAGRIVRHAVTPLMVEIRSKDLIQILVGAAVLSVPISLTEEAWNLAEQLSTARIGVLAGLSLALKRIVIVAFPASMSAALSDSIR